MRKKHDTLHPDAPLRHPDHPRPVTRREFIRQGFMTGGAVVTGSTLLNLFLHPEEVHALSNDVANMDMTPNCLANATATRIPFICFDLAGGANFAASNVLVGKQGGQRDNLDATGYSRLGLPAGRIPGMPGGRLRADDNGDHTNSELGLHFHSESGLLAGILSKLSVGARALVNGAVIPARSENDTGNNPHNPLYGIARVGVKGGVTTLIGSVNSESGGNSLAPALMINPNIRPTKVDRPSDVTGMVDTGNLVGVLSQNDAVRVMESVARISNMKIGGIDTRLAATMETDIKRLMRCGYVKAASLAESFGSPAAIDPLQDANIVSNNGGIFRDSELGVVRNNNGTISISGGDGELRKTASVMKMVLNSTPGPNNTFIDNILSGAGSITMGGYDYHTGDRRVGEARDLRAGKCIGACLEYAHRMGLPLMVYVFSDGSVFSDGTIDNTTVTDNGTGTTITLPGGKGVWTGDSSTTACSFFLVYNPGGIPTLIGANDSEKARHQQIGWFRPTAAVETTATPAANNVNLLVETVILNYMALHDLQGQFPTLFPRHGLGNPANFSNLIAFNPLPGLASKYTGPVT